jgi:uncharacterized protein (UPF0332 family)/predicted nucleotidyltransferase
MKFENKKFNHPHKDKYHKEDLEIAMLFAKHCLSELNQLVKTVVLFGSSLRYHKEPDKNKEPHDIDILLIINDVNINMNSDMSNAFKVVLGDIIKKTSDRIHVTPLLLTTFWELVKQSDPIVINMLRDGIPIIDSGIYEPLQILLYRGRIRPTWESIWSYYYKAPQSINNARRHVLQAVVDLYWAVIDSAHAALMKVGEVPPSPDNIVGILEKKFYNHKLIHKHHLVVIRDLYDLSKKITKGEVNHVRGSDYDRYLRDAEDFVKTMKRIIDMDTTFIHKNNKK